RGGGTEAGWESRAASGRKPGTRHDEAGPVARTRLDSAGTYGLELLQVLLHFPVADLGPVLVPLGALRHDVVRHHVVAQRLGDHGVLLELVDRLAERPRQLSDALRRDRRGIHLEQALLDRVAEG